MAGFIITPSTSPTSSWFTGCRWKRVLIRLRCVYVVSCIIIYVLQNTQRISSSQSAQPLATPVVSVTTPSLAQQGLVYSSMPTSYNPAGESGAWTQSPRLGLFVLRSAGSWSFLCDIDIGAKIRVLTVHGCICFYRLLPEQRGDLLPAGLRLSRALARLHVGMATASAGPGSS